MCLPLSSVSRSCICCPLPPVALTQLPGPSHALPAAYLGKSQGLCLPVCGAGVFFCPQGLCTAVGRAMLSTGPPPPASCFGLDQTPSLPLLPPVRSGAGLPSRPGWSGAAEGKAPVSVPLSWQPASLPAATSPGSSSHPGQAGLAWTGNGRPLWTEGLASLPTSPLPGSAAAPALPSCFPRFPALVPAEMPALDKSPGQGGCIPQLCPGDRCLCCCGTQ